MRKTTTMAVAMVLAMAAAAAATPTISLVGTYNATTWGMYLLSDSQGDNDGVCMFAFKVGNVLTAANVSPSSTSYVGNSTGSIAGVYGFGQQHVANQIGTGAFECLGGIDPGSFPTIYNLKHMGQQVVGYTVTSDNGSISAPMYVPTNSASTLTVPANSSGITPGNYAYSFEVGSGTMTPGAIPTLVTYADGKTAVANVLQVGLNSSMAANASALFIPAPEPATLVLLALGGVVALRRRMRRS
jgi:hypothetical protein